jgi:hypothetical protein
VFEGNACESINMILNIILQSPYFHPAITCFLFFFLCQMKSQRRSSFFSTWSQRDLMKNKYSFTFSPSLSMPVSPVSLSLIVSLSLSSSLSLSPCPSLSLLVPLSLSYPSLSLILNTRGGKTIIQEHSLKLNGWVQKPILYSFIHVLYFVR